MGVKRAFFKTDKGLKRLIKAYVDEGDIKAVHSYTSDLSFNIEENKRVECDIKALCKKWGLECGF